MKKGILALQGAILLYLAYVTVWIATSYAPQAASRPILLWLLDLINLYIHEAGHLFFALLGDYLHALGGSLFQVLVPLTLAVVTFRQTPQHVAYPLFWAGESLVNVSPYIQDAPHMKLRLIASGLRHDWNYLLHGHLDWAEPLGEGVFLLGLLTCAIAVGTGVYFAIRAYRESLSDLPPGPESAG